MGGRRTSREPSKVSYYAVLVALAFFASVAPGGVGFQFAEDERRTRPKY